MGRVYKWGGLYRIAVQGDLKKRFPKWTKRFRAPYWSLLSGATLDLRVFVDLPPQARKARPFEIVVNLHSTDTSVLGELLLLDWHIALDSAWLAKQLVCQPLGVWTYEGDAVVAACLTETPRRPLKDWLRLAKDRGDPQLAQRLSLRVRRPPIAQATHAGSLGQGGGSVQTLSPVTTLYQYSPGPTLYQYRDAPTRRAVSERLGDSAAAEQRHKEWLPSSLQVACEEMNFGDLRRFLDDCLTGQEENVGPDCPSSEEEFLGLLEILREKIYRPPNKYSHRVEIVERIGRDITQAFVEFGTDLPAGRLPWRLLPPGELSVERLRHHYKALQHRNPHIRYDPERITKAYSLGPDQCYIGTDEFDGYVVFTFAGTDRTLLECPVYGNAIYVLGPDWRRLSKMSKQELLSGRPRGVDKIVHKGDWFGRAKLALGIR